MASSRRLVSSGCWASRSETLAARAQWRELAPLSNHLAASWPLSLSLSLSRHFGPLVPRQMVHKRRSFSLACQS